MCGTCGQLQAVARTTAIAASCTSTEIDPPNMVTSPDTGNCDLSGSTCTPSGDVATHTCAYVAAVAPSRITYSCGDNRNTDTKCAVHGRHNCPAGTQSPISSVPGRFSNACAQCPAGQFGLGGLTPTGVTYLEGLESPNVNAANQAPTDAQLMMLLAHAASCEQCPSGQYQPESGKSSCLPCTVPEFQPATGQLHCYTADAGYYVVNNFAIICPLGHYCSQGVKTACQAGTVATDLGMTACTTCPPDSESNSYGTSCVTRCTDKQYKTNPADRDEACITCNVGSYTSGAYTLGEVSRGHSTCSPCPVGSKCDGSNEMVACTAGRYSDQQGMSTTDTCKGCAAGKWAATYDTPRGASQCQDCPAGSFNDVGLSLSESSGHAGLAGCQQCPQNTYQALAGQTSCQMTTYCGGVGQMVDKAGSVVRDVTCKCAPGAYTLSSSVCMLCTGANEYSTTGSVTECSTCSDNGFGATGPYVCEHHDDTSTTCGPTLTLAMSGDPCPGGATPVSLQPPDCVTGSECYSFDHLTAADWPPYQCSDAFGSVGHTQCKSAAPRCTGAWNNPPLHYEPIAGRCKVGGFMCEACPGYVQGVSTTCDPTICEVAGGGTGETCRPKLDCTITDGACPAHCYSSNTITTCAAPTAGVCTPGCTHSEPTLATCSSGSPTTAGSCTTNSPDCTFVAGVATATCTGPTACTNVLTPTEDACTAAGSECTFTPISAATCLPPLGYCTPTLMCSSSFTGQTAEQCAALDTAKAAADFQCEFQCEAGYVKGEGLNWSGTCRAQGPTEAGAVLPQYMVHKIGGKPHCSPAECPLHSFAVSPGQGVVGGCLPDGGWSSVTAPALILTQTAPYFLENDITECLAGTASEPGATTCMSCEDGVTWAGPGQSSCTPCIYTGCIAGYHQKSNACTITSAPPCVPNAACESLTCPERQQLKVSASALLCETATCSARDNAQCCEDRGIISDGPSDGPNTGFIIAIVVVVVVGLVAVGLFLYSRMGGASEENNSNDGDKDGGESDKMAAPAEEDAEEQEYEENQTEPENFEED